MKNSENPALTSAAFVGGGAEPAYFYQRFRDGMSLGPDLPRITSKQSESQFAQRDEGLRLLFINAPIREWSYPNILPIGHAYIGSVAVMDGHDCQVLDLNAERSGPLKVSDDEIDAWVEKRVTETLNSVNPDVIGLGGIITQYRRLKKIAETCR